MRIIAGKFKRQALATPGDKNIRPTSDRIRESIFNILQHQDWMPPFSELHCLDGFCGTGALGFEALSRGVADVTFIDQDLKICQKNQQKFDPERKNTKLVKQDLSTKIKPVMTGFDLIFLDPPYGKDLLPLAIKGLIEAGYCNNKCVFVLETEKKEILSLPDHLQKRAEKCYASTKVHFYQYIAI